MSQKVTVTINPKTGEASYEIEGVLGGKCVDITAALTATNSVKSQQLTQEYNTPETLPDYIHEQGE